MKHHFFLYFCMIALVAMTSKTACASSIDSIVIQPTNPTTNDSIIIEFLIYSGPCTSCDLHRDTVCMLGDTAIFYYSRIVAWCNLVRCPIGWDTMQPVLTIAGLLKIGPLSAGKYGVYFGMVFPVDSAEKVADFTVTNPANISHPIISNNMNLSVKNKPLAAYSIRGELLNERASRLTKGICIVKTDGGRFEISNFINSR
ncbi:MAG TPA: hypothetical protein VLX68_13170 [Chitinivibrionales bacterium]|nr:hypothetical protein [Chitinivibrionales bacterium]